MARTMQTARKRVESWAELPESILLLILDHLSSPQDLAAVRQVCERWSQCALHDLQHASTATEPDEDAVDFYNTYRLRGLTLRRIESTFSLQGLTRLTSITIR